MRSDQSTLSFNNLDLLQPYEAHFAFIWLNRLSISDFGSHIFSLFPHIFTFCVLIYFLNRTATSFLKQYAQEVTSESNNLLIVAVVVAILCVLVLAILFLVFCCLVWRMRQQQKKIMNLFKRIPSDTIVQIQENLAAQQKTDSQRSEISSFSSFSIPKHYLLMGLLFLAFLAANILIGYSCYFTITNSLEGGVTRNLVFINSFFRQDLAISHFLFLI